MPQTNILAYLVSSLATRSRKSFLTLTPVVVKLQQRRVYRLVERPRVGRVLLRKEVAKNFAASLERFRQPAFRLAAVLRQKFRQVFRHSLDLSRALASVEVGLKEIGVMSIAEHNTYLTPMLENNCLELPQMSN